MNGAQIAMIIIYGINLGSTMVTHNQPKTGKNNFWVTLISTGISAVILAWGGFWS